MGYLLGFEVWPYSTVSNLEVTIFRYSIICLANGMIVLQKYDFSVDVKIYRKNAAPDLV